MDTKAARGPSRKSSVWATIWEGGDGVKVRKELANAFPSAARPALQFGRKQELRFLISASKALCWVKSSPVRQLERNTRRCAHIPHARIYTRGTYAHIHIHTQYMHAYTHTVHTHTHTMHALIYTCSTHTHTQCIHSHTHNTYTNTHIQQYMYSHTH